ncbi:MAG: FlgD immunoglobulin-like domain containing protein [Candidatus Eisenbacteria bacterium]
MRVAISSTVLAAMLLTVTAPAEAAKLIGWYPKWFEDTAWCPYDEATSDFASRLSRLKLSSDDYSYYLVDQLTDTPEGLPADYVDNFSDATFNVIKTHGSELGVMLTFFATAAARDAVFSALSSIDPNYQSHFFRATWNSAFGIGIYPTGIQTHLQPTSNDAIVACLACLSAALRGDFFPGIPDHHRNTTGPAYAGYEYCIYPDGSCNELENALKCLTCGKFPLYGNDIEDAERAGSVLTVYGNGNQRLNPEVSCWDWVGYFYAEGYADGNVYCSVLNEDPTSQYLVRGYGSGTGPDTLITSSGLGTDGTWRLRTYAWPLQTAHSTGDIVHIDADGVATVSDRFPFAQAEVPPGFDWLLENPDTDTGVLESLDPPFGNAPEVVTELYRDETEEPPIDEECADVVVYSADADMIGPVRDHVQNYLTAEGRAMKVRCFWGPPDFENIQAAIAEVHQANRDYLDICEPSCPRDYPVFPGPVGVLVGDPSRVRYHSFDDDPVNNPCRQERCCSYNDAGNSNYDANWIPDCPIMVIDAQSVDSLVAKLATAEEWNAGEFVESSGRVLVLAGDDFNGTPGTLLSDGLAHVTAAYQTQGTPAVQLLESDYESYWDGKAAARDVINQGVESIWFQGYATGVDHWTDFLRGTTCAESLDTKQRVMAFGPTCEVLGVRWNHVDDPFYRRVQQNDPERTVVIGILGQMNGDWDFRHEMAREVLVNELESRETWETMAHVAWRVNYVLATQFGGMYRNYGRGLSLFANGLVWPPAGVLSTADAPTHSAGSRSMALWATRTRLGIDIRFTLEGPGDVLLEVFAVNGRKVGEIVRGQLQEGTHRWTWYGRDTNGTAVASGVYLLRLRAKDGDGEHVATSKVVVVK